MASSYPSPTRPATRNTSPSQGALEYEQSQILGISKFCKKFYNIPHKALAVIYVDEDDELCTLETPNTALDQVPPHVKARFQRLIALAKKEHYNSFSEGRKAKEYVDKMRALEQPKFPRTEKERKRPMIIPPPPMLNRKQKRQKFRAPIVERPEFVQSDMESDHSDGPEPPPTPIDTGRGGLRSLVLCDDGAIDQYYQERFEQIQQKDCKTISKAWIRSIHPKKQSTHPYIKGWETRPKWWPPTGCDHKEPDHLRKDHRIHLLKWILNLKTIPVAKLEKATGRRLEAKIKKYPLLKEVYGVAKKRESCYRRELDGNTTIWVASNAKDLFKTEAQQPIESEDDGPGYSDSESDTTTSSPNPASASASQILSPVGHLGLGSGDEQRPLSPETLGRADEAPLKRPSAALESRLATASRRNSQVVLEPELAGDNSPDRPSQGYHASSSIPPRGHSTKYGSIAGQMYNLPTDQTYSNQSSQSGMYSSFGSEPARMPSQPPYMVSAQQQNTLYPYPMMMLPTSTAQSMPDVPVSSQRYGHENQLASPFASGNDSFSHQLPGSGYPEYLGEQAISQPSTAYSSFTSHASSDSHMGVKMEGMEER